MSRNMRSKKHTETSESVESDAVSPVKEKKKRGKRKIRHTEDFTRFDVEETVEKNEEEDRTDKEKVRKTKRNNNGVKFLPKIDNVLEDVQQNKTSENSTDADETKAVEKKKKKGRRRKRNSDKENSIPEVAEEEVKPKTRQTRKKKQQNATTESSSDNCDYAKRIGELLNQSSEELVVEEKGVKTKSLKRQQNVVIESDDEVFVSETTRRSRRSSVVASARKTPAKLSNLTRKSVNVSTAESVDEATEEESTNVPRRTSVKTPLVAVIPCKPHSIKETSSSDSLTPIELSSDDSYVSGKGDELSCIDLTSFTEPKTPVKSLKTPTKTPLKTTSKTPIKTPSKTPLTRLSTAPKTPLNRLSTTSKTPLNRASTASKTPLKRLSTAPKTPVLSGKTPVRSSQSAIKSARPKQSILKRRSRSLDQMAVEELLNESRARKKSVRFGEVQPTLVRSATFTMDEDRPALRKTPRKPSRTAVFSPIEDSPEISKNLSCVLDSESGSDSGLQLRRSASFTVEDSQSISGKRRSASFTIEDDKPPPKLARQNTFDKSPADSKRRSASFTINEESRTLTRSGTFTKDEPSKNQSLPNVSRFSGLLQNVSNPCLDLSLSDSVANLKSPKQVLQESAATLNLSTHLIEPFVKRLQQQSPPSGTSTPLSKKLNNSTKRSETKLNQSDRNNTSKKIVPKKMPNFALIHQKTFAKLENLQEMHERKAKRAQMLLSGQKPKVGLRVIEPSPKKAQSKKMLFFQSSGEQSDGAASPSKLGFKLAKKPSPKKMTPVKLLPKRMSPVKVAATKVSPAKLTAQQKSPAKVATQQKSPAKLATKQMSPVKVASQQKSPAKLTAKQMSPVKVATQQMSPAKLTAKKMSPAKVAAKLKSPRKLAMKKLSPKKPSPKKSSPKKFKSHLPRFVSKPPPPTAVKTDNPQNGNLTRFGFKKVASKQDQIKAVATKSNVNVSSVEDRRNYVKGVRSNKRFELLMQMRKK